MESLYNLCLKKFIFRDHSKLPEPILNDLIKYIKNERIKEARLLCGIRVSKILLKEKIKNISWNNLYQNIGINLNNFQINNDDFLNLYGINLNNIRINLDDI